jgi:hypothetical protein
MTYEQFSNQSYINLETYRKSGEAVQTPVWFVQQAASLYIRTIDGSGKVKRIRNNPQVRVAPCEVNGEVTGPWAKGQANLLSETDAATIDPLFDQKYGDLKRMLEQQNQSKGLKYIMIVVKI